MYYVSKAMVRLPTQAPRQTPPTLNSGIDIGGVGVVDWVNNIRSVEDDNDRGCEINQFVF